MNKGTVHSVNDTIWYGVYGRKVMGTYFIVDLIKNTVIVLQLDAGVKISRLGS